MGEAIPKVPEGEREWTAEEIEGKQDEANKINELKELNDRMTEIAMEQKPLREQINRTDPGRNSLQKTEDPDRRKLYGLDNEYNQLLAKSNRLREELDIGRNEKPWE